MPDNQTAAIIVFIGEKEVRRRLDNISRTQLHYLRKAKKFPAPVRLSTNRIAWPEPVINEWIATKIAEAAA